MLSDFSEIYMLGPFLLLSEFYAHRFCDVKNLWFYVVCIMPLDYFHLIVRGL